MMENNSSFKSMIIQVIVDDDIKTDFILIILGTFIQIFSNTFKKPLSVCEGKKRKYRGLIFNNVKDKAHFHTKISKQKQQQQEINKKV